MPKFKPNPGGMKPSGFKMKNKTLSAGAKGSPIQASYSSKSPVKFRFIRRLFGGGKKSGGGGGSKVREFLASHMQNLGRGSGPGSPKWWSREDIGSEKFRADFPSVDVRTRGDSRRKSV